MAKRTKLQPIGVKDWMVLSADVDIKNRIAADPYSMAYGSLLPCFAKLRSVTWDDAVIGLHVVYGWMPTIPKLNGIMQWDQQRKDRMTLTLTQAIDGNVPSDDGLCELMAFSNNSMIGASKLLHFLNPELFPIWDSRVAKAFFNRSNINGQQVNKVEKWKLYQFTLISWLADQQVVRRCGELRSLASHLKGLTDLRLVELILFHKTVSKRKPAKI